MTIPKSTFMIAAGLVVFIAAVNVGAVIAEQRSGSHAPLGLAAGMTGMLAFVGMLVLTQQPAGAWRVTEAAMRNAIAAAIVAEYLALVSMAAFINDATDRLSPLSQTLITNFTTVVGIVIAFYFGASAFVEARRISANRGETRDSQP